VQDNRPSHDKRAGRSLRRPDWLWRALRHYWRLELVSLLVLLAQGGAAVAFPMALRNVFDAALTDGVLSAAATWLVILAIVPLCQFVLNTVAGTLFTLIQNRVALRSRKELNDTWYRMPEMVRQRLTAGELLARSTQDIEVISRFTGVTLANAAAACVSFLAVSVYLSTVCAPLLVVAVAAAVPIGFLTARFGKQLILTANRTRAAYDRVVQRLHVTLRCLPYIRACHTEPVERREYVRALRTQADAAIDYDILCAKFSAHSTVVLSGTSVVIIVLGVTMLDWRWLSIGGLVAFISSFGQLVSPMGTIVRCVLEWKNFAVSLQRVDTFLNLARTGTGPGGRGIVVHSHGAQRGPQLVASGLSFSYADRTVFRDVAITVSSGSLVLITGESGAGKSTLLRVLAGVVRPTAGAVDITVPDATMRIRDAVTFLPQELVIFPESVEHNLAYGLSAAARSAPGFEQWREAVLSQLGLGELVDSLPAGLETPLDGAEDRLSAGQRQRLCLARAFLGQSHFLLLDEPTTALDEANVLRLTQMILAAKARGAGVLVATHDARLLQHADMVYQLTETHIQVVQSQRLKLHDLVLAAC